MKSVHRVELIGRLGVDPDVAASPSGVSLCIGWVVTEDTWHGRKGEFHEVAEWHRFVAWGRLGEDCCQYCVRGDVVYLDGRLNPRAWQDAGDRIHYVTEIVAQRIILLDRPSESPEGREEIYIPENVVRAAEPYAPPAGPDHFTLGELEWEGGTD